MRVGNFKNTLTKVLYISVAVLGVAIRAIAGDTVSLAVEHKVDIRNFLYDPDPIVITLGDTITWTNLDIVPHTATLSDTNIGTGEITVSGSRSMIIQERGKLDYICRYHANMRGVIMVQ